MFGGEGDMVPPVPPVVVGGVIQVAVLLLMEKERPLLVELDLIGLRGKKPRSIFTLIRPMNLVLSPGEVAEAVYVSRVLRPEATGWTWTTGDRPSAAGRTGPPKNTSHSRWSRRASPPAIASSSSA